MWHDLEMGNTQEIHHVTYRWKGNCLLYPMVPTFPKSVMTNFVSRGQILL
jgi:hypothetical protein